MIRNTQAQIDLSALDFNICQARKNLRPETKLLAVIKANAYGHGIIEVGQYLERKKTADYFAVAIVEEGIELRTSGITLPILVLGATDNDHMKAAVENDLSLTIFTVPSLLSLQAEAKRLGRTAKIHIKIDSGMHRIGIQSEAVLLDFLAALKSCPNVQVEGVFTHFAVADTSDKEFTDEQAARFMSMVELVKKAGYNPLVHCCNSGGIFQHSEYQFDMVRLGISMYGCPVNERVAKLFPLRPLLSWKTKVTNLFTLKKGQGLSYGLRYIADRDIRVATLPVGYGDGYKRCLTNKAEVLIGGKRCKQIGTICMDQMMCLVSEVDDIKIGDEAVLIGTQAEEAITADEMALWADTISYEILLSISDRVPRIYKD